MFGWEFQQRSPEYAWFKVEGDFGGGIGRVDGEMPEPCIAVYIGVDDIPATLKKAELLGAKVERPKKEIDGNLGFEARLRDPCGCRIGLWSKT